jgi:putative transposase
VLAWRLSITMEADFYVEALREAMERHGRPEIFNTDQGVQFTSAAFLDQLSSQGVRISMDGKGRFLDNIFIERLWRSLKYEGCTSKRMVRWPKRVRASAAGWGSTMRSGRTRRWAIGRHAWFMKRQPVSMWTTLPHRFATLPRCPHTHRHISAHASPHYPPEIAA